MVDLPDPVLFHEFPADKNKNFSIGVASLHAPQTLNALSLEMIRPLDQKLRQWASDPNIVAVVLQGSGEKAFCAGGNVRRLRRALLENREVPNPFVVTYFTEEYCLDYLIHTYPKPLIVWGSGIVMGGGVGLMAGARYRVVTEMTRLAMPEVTIGLYPDVGGSWFLNRLIGRMGLFLALTAAPLNAADTLFLGLGDYFCSSKQRGALLELLKAQDWSAEREKNHKIVGQALRQLSQKAEICPPESLIRKHFDTIQSVTEGEDFLTVCQQILALSSSEDAWLKQAAQKLRQGSPTSAALSWEIARRARHLSLAEVFRMELVLSVRCGEHHDFVEGVRALLVDKDLAPEWSPARLEDVDFADIQKFFVSFWTPWAHPLAGLGTGLWSG